MVKKNTLPDLFLELAVPDEDGFSREVPVEEFIGKYEKLRFGNGGSWCRDDGSLAKKYNINRIKIGNRIIAVMLEGYKKQPIEKPIPQNIRNEITKKRCTVLYTGNTECDHKDGRRDDPRLSDSSKVKMADFQPLSKPANNAKRQHCKECRDTNVRFDARKLGYSIPQIKGGEKYNGTCIGCYWHDPFKFNRAISEKFKNKS